MSLRNANSAEGLFNQLVTRTTRVMNPCRRWTIFFLVLLTFRIALPTPTLSAAEEPRTSAQELASFHLADSALTIELVASEPDVVSPVAIALGCGRADVRGRDAGLSDSPTNGHVKLLEDRDGDGRYERVTVFADKLPFPNGVLPWKGGVLITGRAEHLVYEGHGW
jgi:hypothetical protein